MTHGLALEVWRGGRRGSDRSRSIHMVHATNKMRYEVLLLPDVHSLALGNVQLRARKAATTI